MSDPVISIIIPVYNAEQFIKRCLLSILNQSFQHYEIICVNDCSPDNSQAIIDGVSPLFNGRLHTITNEGNLGGGASREKALRIACGQYVIFIDSDDYIANDYLEVYYRKAVEDGTDVVVGGFTKDIDGRLVRHSPSRGPWCLTTYSISCAKLYKRSFLIEHDIRYSNIRCGEDIFFGMCLLAEKASYSIIEYYGYHYFFNVGSTTNSVTPNQNMERGISTIFDQFLNRYDPNLLDLTTLKVIEYTYLANMLNALLVYGHGCGIFQMKDKIAFFHNDLKEKFPHYLSNPYLNPFKAKGQTAKIRFCVSAVCALAKIHADKLFFFAVSIL